MIYIIFINTNVLFYLSNSFKHYKLYYYEVQNSFSVSSPEVLSLIFWEYLWKLYLHFIIFIIYYMSLMSTVRCIPGVYMGVSDVYLVCIWCESVVYLLCTWWVPDMYLVCIWCVSGAYLVRIWCVSGVYLVCINIWCPGKQENKYRPSQSKVF